LPLITCEHLEENIDFTENSRSELFFSISFFRIFHAFVGETVNDFVFRKRMEKAACTLVYLRDLNITEIASQGKMDMQKGRFG